jgi:hypothetical protein
MHGLDCAHNASPIPRAVFVQTGTRRLDCASDFARAMRVSIHTAARIAISTHKVLYAISAMIFILNSLYLFSRQKLPKRKQRIGWRRK